MLLVKNFVIKTAYKLILISVIPILKCCTRGHIHEAPQVKTEVKGNLWHSITTKPENITNLKDYGRLQIQFCVSLRGLQWLVLYQKTFHV